MSQATKLIDLWVTLPQDATREMIDAAQRVEEAGYDAMLKAMIAAAPRPPFAALAAQGRADRLAVAALQREVNTLKAGLLGAYNAEGLAKVIAALRADTAGGTNATVTDLDMAADALEYLVTLADGRYTADTEPPALVEPPAPATFIELAEQFLASGRAYWEVAVRERQPGAVQWIMDKGGACAVFTRGEYAEQLREFLEALPLAEQTPSVQAQARALRNQARAVEVFKQEFHFDRGLGYDDALANAMAAVFKEVPVDSLPSICDGLEQEAFEAYAKGQGMNMTLHPLHYLFLAAPTSCARDAWKAGLSYCLERITQGAES